MSWACPRCSATPNKGSAKLKDGCRTCSRQSLMDCQGFICECLDDSSGDDHGTAESPCPDARCHHCGWSGVFPPRPVALRGWKKTAWDAGWRPLPGKE